MLLMFDSGLVGITLSSTEICCSDSGTEHTLHPSFLLRVTPQNFIQIYVFHPVIVPRS